MDLLLWAFLTGMQYFVFIILGIIFGEYSGENFYKRREEGRCWNRGRRKLEEGVNSRGRITLIKQGSCYRVYRHVGSGAKKPVGFLGPAGSTLVGRVDHPNWHQGSYEAQTRDRQGYRSKDLGTIFSLLKIQVFFDVTLSLMHK